MTRPWRVPSRARPSRSEPSLLDRLPDDVRHRIDISVILETARGGSLVEDPILTHTEFSDGLSGVPITLTNMKPSALKGLGARIGGIIEGTTEYRATLAVGPTTIVGITPIVLASSGDLFGTSDGTGVQEGQATAEWLEIVDHVARAAIRSSSGEPCSTASDSWRARPATST